METPIAPTEWVEGDSRVGFFAGSFLVLWLAAMAGYFVGNAAFPVRYGTPMYAILPAVGVLAAIAVPIGLLYALAVACPQTVGISPIGLTVDFGLSKRFYPWEEVHLRSREALCFRPNSRWPTRIALNSNQRERLHAFLSPIQQSLPRAVAGAG